MGILLSVSDLDRQVIDLPHLFHGSEIRFDVRGDDYASDPDGFGEYCEYLIDDIDKKYAKIKDKVCQ